MATTTGGRAVAVRRSRWLGIVGVGGLVALTALSIAVDPLVKLLGISWVAFVAMAGAAALGARTRTDRPRGLVWAYGLASGAMITSAAVFVVPPSMNIDPTYAGFGIAAGVLTGFAAHTIGHRLSHREYPVDTATLQLTAHALAAGSIIGVIYAGMPDLGPLLGLAIVSHKGPAGYAAARRLAREGRSVAPLLLPAAGVGLAALPVGLLDPTWNPTVQAAVFGFAAGVFLHVAMDFLPRCELGGEVYEVARADDNAHALLDRLRVHAVVSTALGGVAVYLAWLVVG